MLTARYGLDFHGLFPCASVVGLLTRRSAFDPRSVHVTFVVGNVALGQVLLAVFGFSTVSISPPMSHTHLHVALSRRSNGWRLERFSVNRGQRIEKKFHFFFFSSLHKLPLHAWSESNCPRVSHYLYISRRMSKHILSRCFSDHRQSAPAGAHPDQNIWMSQCETLHYCMRYSSQCYWYMLGKNALNFISIYLSFIYL